MQEQNLELHEIPNRKRIVEIRSLPGQLKVVASWWFIWNTIHQITLDIFVAVVVCNMLSICTRSNLPLINVGRTLLAACTSIAHVNMRMDSKAKRRWDIKYRADENVG